MVIVFRIETLPYLNNTFRYWNNALINSIVAYKYLLTWTGQAFLHELLLGKASPPFVWLAVFRAEHLFHNTITGLVAKLQQILAHKVGILGRLRFGVNSVQWKTCVTGNVKLGNGQAVHFLLTLRLACASG